MTATLASPVYEIPATLNLAGGQRLEVDVFVAVGQSIMETLEEPRRFLPITVADRFRLVSRARLAFMSIPIFRADWLANPAAVERPVIVETSIGVRLRGRLVFLPARGRTRVTDHLNDEGAVIALRASDTVHLIDKAHILWVEEAS